MLKKFLSRKFIVLIGTEIVNMLMVLKIVPDQYKPQALVIVGSLSTMIAAVYIIVQGNIDKKK